MDTDTRYRILNGNVRKVLKRVDFDCITGKTKLELFTQVEGKKQLHL
jgi:hypothetical protein